MISTYCNPKQPDRQRWAFFMLKNMANIDFDEYFCTLFTRQEWQLFLNIASLMDENKEAMISMKQLEVATKWHYNRIIVNAARLVEMGVIENIPTDDTSGNKKVFYRILAPNVRYVPGNVPKNGFCSRIPRNQPTMQKIERPPDIAPVEAQKRKRTPVLISQKAERVNF